MTNRAGITIPDGYVWRETVPGNECWYCVPEHGQEVEWEWAMSQVADEQLRGNCSERAADCAWDAVASLRNRIAELEAAQAQPPAAPQQPDAWQVERARAWARFAAGAGQSFADQALAAFDARFGGVR